jgi:hypothetical protein
MLEGRSIRVRHLFLVASMGVLLTTGVTFLAFADHKRRGLGGGTTSS